MHIMSFLINFSMENECKLTMFLLFMNLNDYFVKLIKKTPRKEIQKMNQESLIEIINE